MAQRKGEMTDMRPSGGGKTRLTFSAPSRGLIGYHGEFLSDTRGTGIMNRLFEKYGPYKGPIQGRQNGVLISMEQGEAVAYALNALEERGVLFISPGDKLYEGMVIGENAKPQDLEVNPLKSKQLTNFRASGGKDESIRLTPPRRMTPRAGDRLHPGRRAGRGDAQAYPHSQALPRSPRKRAEAA
jgi:GTP-binding protein